jgi:HPt (histidine-containing phosphotransfer) domain-containing protein
VGRQFQEYNNSRVFVASEPLVFDRQQFEASTMSDLALQREILGLFFVQVEEALNQLKIASLTADEAKFMSHTLRGAAAAIGACEIEKLASEFDKRLLDQPQLAADLSAAGLKFKHATVGYLPTPELH